MDSQAAVIRVTTLVMRPGQRTGLLEAAAENATAARRAPGCLSAEVCEQRGEEGRFLVVSRWSSRKALDKFLEWHKSVAHASLADFTLGKPTSLHHEVVAGGERARTGGLNARPA
ncbi:MAG TPA: antibiotic biosynthesis monooxygenase family protein [Microbacteriaceae bacterium]|nr:antibiotic biosynthesis monooxygenase family protein [Microbacteriaceae bacterium]